MKYRIIERKYNNGEVIYFCQRKILFWWFTLKDEHGKAYGYMSLDSARKYIDFKTYNDKIIEV